MLDLEGRAKKAEMVDEERINLLFALPRRETFRFLRRSYFELRKTLLGKTTLSKTTKASLSPKEFETLSKCRMYGNIDFLEECPVACFSLPLSKLAPEEDLFYKPFVG